jgi:predicted anti-sigma-YlaC factor YlaD
MNCESFNNVQDLYTEGRLSPRRKRAADAHLAECTLCRAASEPVAVAPAARMPEDFKARLRAAAKAAPSAPAKASASDLPLWPRESRGIALAALALLVVGLLIAAGGAPSQSAGVGVVAVEEP